MPENIRFSNPDTMEKPPGYSQVVEVIGPGRMVYFAGQLGIDKSGRMGLAPANRWNWPSRTLKLRSLPLAPAFEHVVKLNNYIVDIGAEVP
jgi:hypothetical protein